VRLASPEVLIYVPAANFVWLICDSQSFIAACASLESARPERICLGGNAAGRSPLQATVPGLDTAGLHPLNLPRPIADFFLERLVKGATTGDLTCFIDRLLQELTSSKLPTLQRV